MSQAARRAVRRYCANRLLLFGRLLGGRGACLIAAGDAEREEGARLLHVEADPPRRVRHEHLASKRPAWIARPRAVCAPRLRATGEAGKAAQRGGRASPP